ncbi:cysteine-rich receptor-like protein kinase 26 [Triticum aestivum]|uniref:cysteine-rich receptor-like protein kinase 26 n=1 Tax=Triticum aestivum TaxID=4565 RepID=UPI001D019FEC|nr:cysteine-rich receptor-like protein kinase 26 [Triticum aestivum]
MATQGVTLETLPNKVPLDFLKKITSNFSKELQLGEGAFGEVYKGILDSGELVAVKKLAENSPVPRETIFDNELQNIMVLEHENIVKLVAFCREAQNRLVQSNGRHIIAEIIETLLCYEYLPKGGLDKSLVGEFSSIEWDIRFKIIKGICQGWQHDTEDCRLWILQNIWPRTNPNEHTKCCGICVTEKWKLETIMSEYELEEDELNQVEACIDSALKCVEIDQKNRPTIQDIVKKLSNL